MTTTKIHSVVCIHSHVLVIFYTPGKCWQFRIISPDGTVFGDYPIYYSAEAAAKAGREKKGVGDRVSGVGNTALDEASNLAQCKRLEKGEATDAMAVGASLFPYTQHPTPYTRPNGAGDSIYQNS